MHLLRRQVRVRGVVQGVGFRPFVHALATRLALSGQVGNDAEGVLTDVQGTADAVEAFCRAVVEEAPPLAVVAACTWQDLSADPDIAPGFTIVASDPTAAAAGRRTLVPPDVATCADCLRELTDPEDRRHRHPFITCTHCGPRFTIVTGLPYDRAMTTMAPFELCPACSAQYHDPADRRFHTQPVACHDCGPVLELVEIGRDPLHREAALGRARQLLAAGRVVAVKGIGGYHLACDATDPAAVRRLRARKRRGDKPFAVLVADLAVARRLTRVDDAEAELLTSPRRPIVLLRRTGPTGTGSTGAAPTTAGSDVADEVAPRSNRLGLMLPPSALHHLLLGLPDDPPGPAALVLTSGNLSGEPIVTDDAEALRRLGPVADAWLRHDRAIHVPCDDSVATVVDGEPLLIRRSRGYAPMPVPLPADVPPTLAVGGDLKTTVCLARGRQAWLSGHIGDMDDLATQQALDVAAAQLQALVEVDPTTVVADAHPAYRSVAWARRRAAAAGLPPVRTVQHHHAHVVAVLAEHGVPPDEPVLGIAFDGTGYGDDGTVWGGEVLLAEPAGYRRVAHLDHVPLAGGDATVRRPYRMALAHLRHAGLAWDADLPPVAACPPHERAVLAHQLATGLASTPTSSMGRLFDAVASLAGVCDVVGYEAQAAMELQFLAEQAATRAGPAERGYALPLLGIAPSPPRQAGVDSAPSMGPAPSGPWRWDVASLIRAVVDDLRDGVDPDRIALRFHLGIAEAVCEVADNAVTAGLLTDPQRRVALSGGVFANTLLLSLTTRSLTDAGYQVLRHRLVPPNDGGLALGQVMVAAAQGARGHWPDGDEPMRMQNEREGDRDVSRGARQDPRDHRD